VPPEVVLLSPHSLSDELTPGWRVSWSWGETQHLGTEMNGGERSALEGLPCWLGVAAVMGNSRRQVAG
jgi:hypothetical protein